MFVDDGVALVREFLFVAISSYMLDLLHTTRSTHKGAVSLSSG